MFQESVKPLWKVKGFFNRTSWKVSDVHIVRYTWVLVAKDKSHHPVADSLRSVPQESWSEQLYQVKRMIRGIGTMLFSVYPQTENVKDPKISLVNFSGAK